MTWKTSNTRRPSVSSETAACSAASAILSGPSRPDDRQHWAEDLFLCDAHVVRDVAEDRRLHEPACPALGRVVALATEQQRRAFLARHVDVVEPFRELRRGRYRPDLRGRVYRIAHAGGTRDRQQLLDEALVDAVLHQQARARDAGLTRRREDAGDRTKDCLLQVGILEDDVGRLAAQPHRGVLEVAGRFLVDDTARHVGAREADLTH